MGALHRHRRFLVALVLGGLAGAAALALPLAPALRGLLALDVFAAFYLAMTLHMTRRTTSADLRRHAEEDDEGIALILLLAMALVVASLTAIFILLNRHGGLSLPEAALALAAVPLGWAVLQVLLAFHYAHRHYAPQGGGLAFPGTEAPGPWDFLYFSLGVAMTAQVSDVVVTQPAMRRVVMLHAVLSFFYNAVILALAVNAGLALAG